MNRKPTKAELCLQDALTQAEIPKELKNELLALLDDVTDELDDLWSENRDLSGEVDNLEDEISELEDRLEDSLAVTPAQDERFERALRSVLYRDGVYSAEELKAIAEEVGVLEAI